MTMFGNAIGLNPGNLGMRLFAPRAGGFVPDDVPQAEADALIAFYNATNGPGWTNSTNWLIDPTVGNWFGVTVAGGHVTALDLNNNNLNGEGLSALAPLTSLTDLRLYINAALTGDIADIDTLTSLTYLRMGSTGVDGDIADIDTLTSLTYLNLGSTGVDGDIADIDTLTSLTYLTLAITGVTQGTIGTMTAMRDCQVWSCGWNQAAVDAFLATMYTNRMAFTHATPVLGISGTNAAPSGIYQPACPPGTGHEYEFELENDSCGDGFNTWTITAN
jgi:hypothetical protein